MSEGKTYNGWTNYETWNVALWLGNEQGSYNHWTSVAQEVWEEAEAKGSFSREEKAALKLADVLKEEVTNDAPDLGASLYSDLLNAALSEVNWYEIAQHYIGDVDKTQDEPEEDKDEEEDDE